MLVGIAVGYSYTNTGFKAPWFANDDESFNSSNDYVYSVTATTPLNSSGGVTPDISISGIIPIINGGTGASTVSLAKNNLQIYDNYDYVFNSTSTQSQIQTAIDTVAADSTKRTILVRGNHTFNGLTIHGDQKIYTFDGVITPTISGNAFYIGNTTKTFTNSVLTLNSIIGSEVNGTGSTQGIVMQNAIRSSVSVNNISMVAYPIKVHSLNFVNDNHVSFGEIVYAHTGIIYDSTDTHAREGNRWTGSIFGCMYSGVNFNNGVGTSGKYTSYYGVIDNMYNASAKDIVDTAGNNIFMMNFVRDTFNPALNTIADTDIVFDVTSHGYMGINFGGASDSNVRMNYYNASMDGWALYNNQADGNKFTIAKIVDNAWSATGLKLDSSLAGTGNDYVCVDSTGTLYRSDAACS